MKKRITLVSAIMIIGVMGMFLFGCKKGGQVPGDDTQTGTESGTQSGASTQNKTEDTLGKYKVDYHDQMDLFTGAKEYYEAGENVRLTWDLIATDTDYTFYVDGESVNYDYDNGVFVIKFIMPDHDIEVYCESKNSMVYDGYVE